MPPKTQMLKSDKNFPYKISKKPQKVNKGGMSTENLGRVLTTRTKHYTRNDPQQLPDHVHWSFAVCIAKSVYDARSNQEIIDDFKNIAPNCDYGLQQIAFVLGNNEQITLEDDPNFDQPDNVRTAKAANKERNVNRKTLATYGIPTLFQYSYWQANWVDRTTGQPVNIQNVKEAYREIKASDPQRATYLRNYERARSFYPFGASRSELYSADSSIKFFTALQQRVSVKATSNLFILNQDADYIDLSIQPAYYKGFADLPETLANNANYAQLVTTYTELAVELDPNKTLFDHYNAAIQAHYAAHRIYPRFIGGAHIYSQTEDMNYLRREPGWRRYDIKACQEWTRFGSEMGNAIKHLIGQYNSFPLYFHEPNTMLRWQGNPVRFGDKSEMDEYFRRELKSHARNSTHQAKFHGGIVLATSQRRGGKPFTVKFSGKFSNGRFIDWSGDDIKALQGMPQEIMQANKWTSSVCTAFEKFKSNNAVSETIQLLKENWNMPKKDTRAVIARLYNLYDPHHIAFRYHKFRQQKKAWPAFSLDDQRSYLDNIKHAKAKRKTDNLNYDKADFEYVLKHYDALKPQANDDCIRQIKLLLKYVYDENTANNILNLAQQTGELRKAMFMSVLIEPALVPALN